MDSKDLRVFAKSHKFITLLTGVGFLVIALVVFEAGVFVGFHKASFAYGWEENYGRNFGDPHGSFGMPGAGLPNEHGADGKIVSVGPTSFIVMSGNEVEKTVTFASSTVIRIGRDATTSAALTHGSYVVVIGDPDASGTVAAELVRVFPPPMDTPKP